MTSRVGWHFAIGFVVVGAVACTRHPPAVIIDFGCHGLGPTSLLVLASEATVTSADDLGATIGRLTVIVVDSASGQPLGHP